jgi:hypothetical protein
MGIFDNLLLPTSYCFLTCVPPPSLDSFGQVATTAEAIHHLQELADLEARKRDRRNGELQASLRALPILQQQLAAVDAMVESAGPPVGLLVEPDLTHAAAAVLELERYVARHLSSSSSSRAACTACAG